MFKSTFKAVAFRLLTLSLVTWSFGSVAQAITPDWLLQGQPAPAIFRSLNFNPTYRIGDEWGKKPVTQDDLKSDTHFQRMAMATARVGSATGFFLGEFNGRLMVATNYHVCPTKRRCEQAVTFPVLGISADIVDFYGAWTDVDLAILEVKVYGEEQRGQLLMASSPFAMRAVLKRGEPLVTIGFGTGSNPLREMVANRDNDCVAFSDSDEYRFMADPDELNPGPYKAWSFANGCDVSHGDSGSAMMNRNTGEVVGIIWTGRIPKSSKVQNSKYLDELLKEPNEDVWKELSYAVPATKIGEYLAELLKTDVFNEVQAATVAEMLK